VPTDLRVFTQLWTDVQYSAVFISRTATDPSKGHCHACLEFQLRDAPLCRLRIPLLERKPTRRVILTWRQFQRRSQSVGDRLTKWVTPMEQKSHTTPAPQPSMESIVATHVTYNRPERRPGRLQPAVEKLFRNPMSSCKPHLHHYLL
jgi:hypothetical protein